MLYQNENGKIKQIRKKPFALERELQTLVEQNLGELFHLQFIKTEFQIEKQSRFDSVAYDRENNAFVVIEYKRGRNESLVDQGYAYLNTVLNRKADLVLLFNEITGQAKLVKDFDWAATRIYFVSPEFTEYQKRATGFLKMPFRLFEVTRYENGAIYVEELNENKIADDPAALTDSEAVEKVNREIKVYSEEELYAHASEGTVELYALLKERLLALGEVTVEPKKCYVSFRHSDRLFCDIEFYKNKMKVYINMKWGAMKDPDNRTRDVTNIGHMGNGAYEFILSSEEDLDYLMMLIRQSYKKV